MNFYHRKQFKSYLVRSALLATLIILWAAPVVYALDPHSVLSQYPHDRWESEKGLPGGTIYAIAQTPDGYLWLGTQKGLVQFDGINFRLIQHSDNPSLPDGQILGLITDVEGNLWIRPQGPSIVRYRDGKFEDVLANLQRKEVRVTSMSLSQDREILLFTFNNGVLKYDGEKFVEVVSKAVLPGSMVISMTETPSGELWMGTRDSGLDRLQDRKVSTFKEGLPDQKINSLLPDGEQGMLVGTDKGLIRWNGLGLTRMGLPAILDNVQILTMVRDRDSNVWIGTDTYGILRLNKNGLVSTEKNIHSGNAAVTALFEDREGNIWAGSDRGLERFRDSAFVTYSTAEGLPSEKNGAIYVDAENRLWLAPLSGGLYWFKDNHLENVTLDGLAQDVVYSITGDKDNLWIGRQRGGLTHIYLNKSPLTAQTYTEKDGLAQNSVYSVHLSPDGSIWAGTLSGGVSRLKNGALTTLTVTNNLASNSVAAITEAADGAIWCASPDGLSKISKGSLQISVERGLPAGNIVSLLNDSSGILWLGTNKGLAYRDRAGQFHSLSSRAALLHEDALGLAEDSAGTLWIATPRHLLQVARSKLLDGSVDNDDIREYELSDGLKSTEGIKHDGSVVTDGAGRIWFSLSRGISMIDVTRHQKNSVPAMVQIQTIAVDGKAIDLGDDLRIPPARQRLIFSYAGLSLSIPERVKFRYLLEGFDQDWSDPTLAHEAIYTNLAPGQYTFHVKASNSDGLWNSEEAVIKFEIAPLFWQTWWFRFLCLVCSALAILFLYRLRLHRVTGRLNARFEERLAERTRIAQELHDSLLQGFVSASMQLNVAADNLPPDSPSRPQLDRIIQIMGQVTKEGRNTLRGLRQSNSGSSGNLEDLLASIRQDFTVSGQGDFRVIVEGAPQLLRPLIRDEVYSIGREALLNAFRHSNADKIEVVVEYAARYLRILVRDDGCGIAPQTIQVGREGHWGLPGMHERAKKIGAKLKVWSRSGAGTEIELLVPNNIAYQKQPAKLFHGWFSRISERKVKIPPTEKETRL